MTGIPEITNLERDMLKEMVNIGVARAADSFAVLAKERVLLMVPEVDILKLYQVSKWVSALADYDEIIQSNINGDLDGKTYLLFNKEPIEKLSELCLGAEMKTTEDYQELRTSMLMEISNILTGALVTEMANLLKLDIFGTPPQRPSHAVLDKFKEMVLDYPIIKPLIFTVKTQFLNQYTQVEFPLILVISAEALEKILGIIRSQKKHGQFLLRKQPE